MKQCPTCNQTYSDDTQSFCLMDGSRLLNESEEKTIVMSSPLSTGNEAETFAKQLPVRKKSKIPLILGLVCLLLLGGCGLITWLLFSSYSRQSKNVPDNQKTEVNVKSSTLSPIPKSSSTTKSLVKESSPKDDALKQSPDKDTSESEDSENITPIGWDTTPGGFEGESGQTYTFRCPEQGTEQAIFGSDIYTDFSSICTAAVHAGVINLGSGGIVTLEFRPGRSIYGSTTRNGIKSNTNGTHARSFVVR